MKTKLTFTFYAFMFLFAAFESYNNQMTVLTFLISFLFISFAILFLLFVGGQNAYDELENSYDNLCKHHFDRCKEVVDLKKELAKYNRNHDKATGKFCKKDGTFKPKINIKFNIEDGLNALSNLKDEIDKLNSDISYTIEGKSIKQLCEENLGVFAIGGYSVISSGNICGYNELADEILIGIKDNSGWIRSYTEDKILTNYKSYWGITIQQAITAIKKHRNIK